MEIGQSYYTDARAPQWRHRSTNRAARHERTRARSRPCSSRRSPGPPTSHRRSSGRRSIRSFRAFQSLSASGTIQSRTAPADAGSQSASSSRATPTSATGSDFLDASTTFRSGGNRLGGTYELQLRRQQPVVSPAADHGLPQQPVLRRLVRLADHLDAALGIPSDKRFGISFTLAGIGSFANPLGSFGGR